MAGRWCFSYSAPVSILVEIAEQADVSVEGVVRVLTREPVSDAVKERVLAVLDDLGPEQTRAVQRFALAALHDVLLRPGEPSESASDDEPATGGEPAAPAPSAAEAPAEPERLPAVASDAALVQLSSVLGELAEAVRDLRRETDAERRERVDDLAVLIDLITTGWQGLNGRLGRLERQLSRLEATRREPELRPAVVAPAPFAPVKTAPAPLPPPADAQPAQAARGRRDRLPLVAALTLVGVGIGTLAILQLASGGPDVERLVSPDPAPATTEVATGASSTTSPRSIPATTRVRPPATTPPVSTSSVLATTVSKPRPPAATTAPATTTPRPTTTQAAPGRTGFQPTRSWAWAPVEGADYYSVEFTRGGERFYRAWPTQPRLTLPDSVVFRPGSYRWRVRPGFGERAANRLGEPVVDSSFTVS